MKLKLASSVLLSTLAFAVTPAFPAAARAHPNMAVRWNQVMLATFSTANVPAANANRLAGVVAAATFDAVNGIERRYTAIHVPPGGDPDASPQAAAASATYTVLINFFPAQKPALDAALTGSLASIDDDSIAAGVQWGDYVGGQIAAWRAGDGFGAT